jgi:hypothetical protein
VGVEDFKRSYSLRTVCEVTREIYDIITANRAAIGEVIYAEIWTKLQEQMRMQKQMDLRLRHYKSTYEHEIFKANDDYKEDEARRGV